METDELLSIFNIYLKEKVLHKPLSVSEKCVMVMFTGTYSISNIVSFRKVSLPYMHI